MIGSGIGDNMRPSMLLNSIERKREREWVPVNQQERDIISRADIIRGFVTKGRKKKVDESLRSCTWGMGMEILRFMSHPHDDEETAYGIVKLAGSYDNDMKTGVLDSIYDECVSKHLPPLWVLPKTISPIDESTDEPRLVINPKGLKI